MNDLQVRHDLLIWRSLQAAKQVVDKLLPNRVSWADMFAISGAVRCPVSPIR